MQTLLMAVETLRRALTAPRGWAATWGPRRPFYVFTAAMLVCGIAALASAAENTLLDAVERGDRAAAVRLLTKGANPNAPGPDGTTAIVPCANASISNTPIGPFQTTVFASRTAPA